MAGITAEKERYEAAIQERLGLMGERVEKEQADAEVAYAEAQARADALQAAETEAFEALITKLTEEMEAAIAEGLTDLGSAFEKARGELKAFIDARLAAW